MSSVKSEDTGSYIMFLGNVTSLVLDCYSVSFLIFPILSLTPSFFFYTVFPFHLHLPRACQMVGVDTCPISTPHKSLCSSCKAEIRCSGITSILMRLES